MVAYSGAMANPEHLAILKQGVEVWNKWRVSVSTKPDLSGFEFGTAYGPQGNSYSGINLAGSDLRGARLDFGAFAHACFIDADISEASLSNIHADQADFTRAKLVTSPVPF
jgi:hypothetical protein